MLKTAADHNMKKAVANVKMKMSKEDNIGRGEDTHKAGYHGKDILRERAHQLMGEKVSGLGGKGSGGFTGMDQAKQPVKMAAGGVAKIRHKQATRTGMPMKASLGKKVK